MTTKTKSRGISSSETVLDDIKKTGARATMLRKAIKRLCQTVDLLETCGVTTAVEHGRSAISAAKAAADEHLALSATSLVPLHAAKSMPRDQDSLMREDGTLRYVSYMKRSNKRPEVVAVSFRVPGLPSLTTSFTLVERDFNVVYAAAVRALAEHVGVHGNPALVETMLSTSAAFKIRYGL